MFCFYLKFYIFEIRLNLNCEGIIEPFFAVLFVFADLQDWNGTVWIGICQPQ
ncbi:hypothetical protein DFQ12_3102 [Sphingobacterium detergens]|uniref:Uncharacterized protein n=1 Tax=Sphingobacterium detergens TaxID=1145106 RepID=A0A420B7T6_SPHD1|nr:hypothetical protein DFQ12_3102 [Sphingobacterium detergens]